MDDLDDYFSMDESDEEGDASDGDIGAQLESDIANIFSTYIKFRELNIQSLLPFESRPVVSLTEEEQDVVNKCTDINLTRLLILNRAHFSQIREQVKQLQAILAQCNKYIAKGHKNVAELKMSTLLYHGCMLKTDDMWKTGAPYFKDSQWYAAPYNADVIKKRSNGELCLLRVSPGKRWTNHDKRNLLNSIKLRYYDSRHNTLSRKLSLLKIRVKFKGIQAAEELEMEQLNEEIHLLERVAPPRNTSEGIDWQSISTVDLKGRHSVPECIAYWNMVLHPSLNTDEWTTEEENRLKKIANTHKFQDWDAIVKELDTNRSPFLAAKHYLSHYPSKFNKERFTPEEDEYIVEVVKNISIGSYIPWGKVAYYFEDRSKYQLYHRYRYYLAYNNTRKGSFTEAEDVLIIFLVKKFGKNFSKLAEHIPDRSPVQLRNRYGNYLDKTICITGGYSYDDDSKILEHTEKHGMKNWGQLACALQRTRSHVRQRYLTLKKGFEKQPDLDLKNIPRRKAPLTVLDNRSSRGRRITAALDKLKNFDGIPKIEQVDNILKMKLKKLCVKKSQTRSNRTMFTGVDQDIVNFFKGTCKFQKENARINKPTLVVSAERIIKLMGFFDQDLACLQCTDEYYDSNNIVATKVFPHVKDILNTELQTPLFGKNSDVGPSSSTDISNGKAVLKGVLPPTLRTLLGFRGIIIKLNMYKNEYKDKNNLQIPILNTLIYNLEQSLLTHDDTDRTVLKYERNLFFKRVYAAFKWPIILSFQYPSQAKFLDFCREPQTVEEFQQNNQTVHNIAGPSACNKVGRPRKKTYHKVALMNRARALNREQGHNNVNNCNTSSFVPDSNDSPEEDSHIRIINISDIKVPITNACIIDKKYVDSLMIKNKNKFVCLESPVNNVQQNGNTPLSSSIPNLEMMDTTCDDEHFEEHDIDMDDGNQVARDAWMNFNDDIKKFELLSELEISDDTDDKVMEDVKHFSILWLDHDDEETM